MIAWFLVDADASSLTRESLGALVQSLIAAAEAYAVTLVFPALVLVELLASIVIAAAVVRAFRSWPDE